MNERGYRHNEPNSVPREELVVWKTVFTRCGVKGSEHHVAADLHLPSEELENLVFGLTEDLIPTLKDNGPTKSYAQPDILQRDLEKKQIGFVIP